MAHYQILDWVGTTGGSHLHRGRQVEDGLPVMLKIAKSEDTPAHAARFRREYAILATLEIPGVLKPATLVDEPGSLMMVLNPFEGEPLENVLTRHKLDLARCLRLGLQLARILGALHSARIVHGDFRPANMMLLPGDEICLLDLSRATVAPSSQEDQDSQLIGNWAYISPEQTGRMNRAVDYRTDFYSLGVMLYRMLTGQLPCQGNDALEWAHCHLASLPRPPSEIDSTIPQVLSAIVLKLLEKMPEDRYQSAHGLQADLERCLSQWEADGAIAPFAIGVQDMDEHLQAPGKFVDREPELKQLLEHYDAMATSQRATLTLVTGSAGIGKSALVQEMRQPVKERGGLFIAGKFDQYQRDIPYSTVTQAFLELVRAILAESEEKIGLWRQQIQAAVGVNGQLIIDVLPQLELIIGPQPPLPRLLPAETQNRFRLVFQKFIGVFAQESHPLTLFLDNMQWADAASLRLVNELVTAPGKNFLMLVGAYRDTDVIPGHPLALALDEMRQAGATVTEISLGPLPEEALGTLMDQMLHCECGAASALVRLVYQKTGGNPFFMTQFLTALVEEGLLTFDAGARTWRWDLAGIEAKGYTDNVAELMVEKLARLPDAVRSMLQLLACLGSDAEEATLLKLSDRREADTRAALSVAARAGLILHGKGMVRFPHDRVQEAAYMSIPAPARATLHARIGRLLMAGKTPAQIEESVFSIVDQLNRGAAAIVDAEERTLLYRLNVLAGMKAKSAAALASARSFLDRAMALLPSDAWDVQYEDALELSLALSECEYLTGNFQRAAELADTILAHARSPRDAARVYLLRIALYGMAGRLEEAVGSMIKGVRLFEVVFPTTDAEIEAAVEAEMSVISRYLEGRSIAGVANSLQLPDGDKAAAIALLVEAIPFSYMIEPDYFSLIIAKAVRLSLYCGHTEDSCFAYSAYGILLISRHRDIASALAFSDMAFRLNEELGVHRRKGQVIATHAVTFAHFDRTVAEIGPMMRQAVSASLDVGDLAYANYVAMADFWAILQEGKPLDEVERMTRINGDFARDSHNDLVYRTIRFEQQLVAELKGRRRSPAGTDGDDFDEAACLAVLEKASFGFGLQSSHLAKQVSAFIYGDYAGALASAKESTRHTHKGICLILFDSVRHFFHALTLTALYPKVSDAQQREFADLLAEELDRHKLWANAYPKNFLHRHALLDAELARIEGRHTDAERLYEQAIRSAAENGFIQDCAIGFELASAFYRARGFTLIADTYLREARAAYARWGADGKVEQLDTAHPQLRAQAALTSAMSGRDASRLDLLSIAKASQAISSRIVLDELVDTLMRIVLEAAGAQTSYLLLVRNDELMVAADASVDQKVIQVQQRPEGSSLAAPLPASIVNYVRRTREQVSLSDVAQNNPFSEDPYFSRKQPKSVLCLPILRQEALTGMLYLESSLITHAFAPECVAALQLLASQAAISLENAHLYADLQEREAKIRRLFESNIVGILFYDLNDGVTSANDAALSIIGYSRQDLSEGKIRWAALTPPEWRRASESAMAELGRTGVCKPFEKELIRKDGSRVPVLTAAAMLEGARNLGVSFILDLTERKRAEEQMLHMANHDALTGLPNRVLLQDRLNQAMSYAHRNKNRVAILFIDLDLFKYINDSLGHQIGDVVLQMTAARLQKCLREGDSVARLGGDEFVITLPVVTDSSDVERVAKEALHALAQPFIVDGHELHISGSIGISLYPEDGTDVETLMRTADTAMYHAKEMGRGKFQFFTAALNRTAQQRLEVGKRLRRALSHDELVLHYQPQVDMESGRIYAAEALLRWRQPGGEAIPCGSFIANAEESGLIVPIGEWTLRQACRQLKIWRDTGHPDLKIAVNLSPRQLEPPDFCIMVEHILDDAGLPADALELEITESLFLQRSEFNLSTLNRLRGMGVQLSLDDFGTGYSSLAYLQRFPVHALKIDQSFVRDIGTDRNHTALITAIIAMAHSLELGVLAEGVETREQASFLLAHGCRAAQGFYYSKAVPAQTFSDLLYKSFASH
ncbi:MAG TPA: EAL domain-containing protein [Noviherbaspirillum sp.]|nr:EAL domain-containing protein [Noviherbaspirillum sp.]